MIESDIVVIGAGPAGLSFCRSLAGSPLKITLIEAQPRKTLENPPFDGREIALTHPSKAILKNLGIWQRFPKEEIYHLREASVVNGNSPFRLHFSLPKINSSGEKIDTLGYLVSNCNIRRAAYESISEQTNIRLITGEKVISCESNSYSATVSLSNQEQVRGKLLVAADSRFSFVRRAMGIAADTHEFGRTVIVFRLEHEFSNEHTASECFFYGSTLALLPLSSHLTNCVITINSHQSSKIMAMSAEELAAHIAEQVEYRFGKMSVVSSIHEYPLVGVHARHFYANRCALIGDAACGMHPVTAHGFNLGLQSQEILSRLVLRQAGQGKDIGDLRLLSTYNRQHQKNTRLLYHGTNAIVKLFTRENLSARFFRHGVLRLSENLPPLKQLITRQLTG